MTRVCRRDVRRLLIVAVGRIVQRRQRPAGQGRGKVSVLGHPLEAAALVLGKVLVHQPVKVDVTICESENVTANYRKSLLKFAIYMST